MKVVYFSPWIETLIYELFIELAHIVSGHTNVPNSLYISIMRDSLWVWNLYQTERSM